MLPEDLELREPDDLTLPDEDLVLLVDLTLPEDLVLLVGRDILGVDDLVVRVGLEFLIVLVDLVVRVLLPILLVDEFDLILDVLLVFLVALDNLLVE
jgi:hypothetical protein